MTLDMPLMKNNITREDLDSVIRFLSGDPKLTQSQNVAEFEREWSRWLGVRHSVFVNSGASANFATIFALKYLYGGGEIIVPSITWVSDIASVVLAGFKPVFVDCDPKNLAMNDSEVISKITDDTRAVFLTHVLGFNGLTQRLLSALNEKNIPLIEDVCESHGATFGGKKLGTFGLASNFSFYYGHHMSTIEGGMICTDNDEFYQVARMLRSHGMVRESTDEALKNEYSRKYPELNPDFIFAYPGFNIRSSEINAVIGRSALKRLDESNRKRSRNFRLFLNNLDKSKYRTDFDLKGSVNYALVVILKNEDPELSEKLEKTLKNANVEFRRGTSGGGNQLMQPYIRPFAGDNGYKNFPQANHIHYYGYYIGNYPSLETDKITALCELLNGIE